MALIKTFHDLKFINHPSSIGVVAAMQFDNGYGVSVIRTEHTYGVFRGLYELAVTDSEGSLTYTTPITTDVLGYLTIQDVTDLMAQIQALPRHNEEEEEKQPMSKTIAVVWDPNNYESFEDAANHGALYYASALTLEPEEVLAYTRGAQAAADCLGSTLCIQMVTTDESSTVRIN